MRIRWEEAPGIKGCRRLSESARWRTAGEWEKQTRLKFQPLKITFQDNLTPDRPSGGNDRPGRKVFNPPVLEQINQAASLLPLLSIPGHVVMGTTNVPVRTPELMQLLMRRGISHQPEQQWKHQQLNHSRQFLAAQVESLGGWSSQSQIVCIITRARCESISKEEIRGSEMQTPSAC